jgi:hypothetical protein
MTESHTAWSKLYKDFMMGLGQEFPQSTLDEFDDGKTGAGEDKKCPLCGVGRLHGGSMLLYEEGGRPKALVNMFHPCCMDGYRSNVKFLYELFLKLKEANPSVKAVMKALDDDLYAYAENITDQSTEYNGFSVRFFHVNHIGRLKRDLMELDVRIVEEALKGYKSGGDD